MRNENIINTIASTTKICEKYIACCTKACKGWCDMAAGMRKKSDLIIGKGSPLPLGATVSGDVVDFSVEVVLEKGKRLSLLLFDKEGKKDIDLDFPENQKIGNVHYISVQGVDVKRYDYSFAAVDSDGNIEVIPDKRAQKIVGREKWADEKRGGIRNAFVKHDFDWQGDERPEISHNNLIIYRLHVRGFTMHESSKVKYNGTFNGVLEKIPYLKELGINYVELMPAYEFDEIMDISGKINYWGYTAGNYFAPKEAYAKNDAVNEFKELVKALHKEGIELGMEFYFVPGTDKQFIVEVLRHWAVNYHVNGFHVNTNVASMELMEADPILAGCKLFGEEWDGSFMYDIRRFLKGDDNKVACFVEHLFKNPKDTGIVNYLASHDSFTVNDMVSYERKHNEANGEDNRDGENINCTWNCGAEGNTLKKDVIELRLKQMKNAWTMLMLSQGIPMLMAGDEFGRTTKGNNNPYCQDNEISWVNWHLVKDNAELLEFVKQLIRFRKEHTILHMNKALRESDWRYVGYPDVSFHGEEAWHPEFEEYSRQIGIMFYEMYSKGTNEFIYAAVNMHYEQKKLALPKLPKGLSWNLSFTTAKDIPQDVIKEKSCVVASRSIYLFTAADNKNA